MYDRAPRLISLGTSSTTDEVGPGKYDPDLTNRRKQGNKNSIIIFIQKLIINLLH